MHRSPEITAVLERYRSGWSLERAFYTNPDLFEYERATWLAHQWFVLAHTSELPRVGSYLVRELLGESLLIVRAGEACYQGFYNVCRHRGSQICREDGEGGVFVCPYHGWSYALDGRLRAASAMREPIDKERFSLKAVSLEEIGGLLFCTLERNPSALAAARSFLPGLEYQGIPQARIAARQHYPTAANWKLVVENFAECYHCLPAHPEYSSIMQHVKRHAVDSATGTREWNAEVSEWIRTRAVRDFPGAVFEGPDGDWDHGDITRFPIGGVHETQSRDGRPVAPLMGRYPRYDGGVATFGVPPFAFFFGLNDHAVMFHFLPRSVELTDVTVTWLVDGGAALDAVDVERLVWLWDVTTLQDKRIIEGNAAGVRSRAYEPGPYSKLELWAVPMMDRYIAEMRAQRV